MSDSDEELGFEDGGGSTSTLDALVPAPLPALHALPFRLRQPSRWARERFDQQYEANNSVMKARHKLFASEHVAAPNDGYRKMHEAYLRMIGTAPVVGCTNFPWEKTLPMDSLDHERLFCLHNLAMLETREAASRDKEPKAQRQHYTKAAHHWRLVGELATRMRETGGGEKPPPEADPAYARAWEQVTLALAQQARVREIEAIAPAALGDHGTHRFMVGQATALARERWQQAGQAVSGDDDLPLLVTPIRILSAAASAQHYGQWARFHNVPPEEGGRDHSACEYRISASVALLQRATQRLVNGRQKAEHEADRLEHKVADSWQALLSGKKDRPARVRLKTWFEEAQARIDRSLQTQRQMNQSITMQPSLEYKEIGLERLLATRDAPAGSEQEADERAGIEAMRKRLRVPDVSEEGLQQYREALGLSPTSSAAPAPAPAPDAAAASTHAPPNQQALPPHTYTGNVEAPYNMILDAPLRETRRLWQQAQARMPAVYNAHIERGIHLVQNEIGGYSPLSPDMEEALLKSLTDEIQPFCRLFIQAPTSTTHHSPFLPPF